MLARRRDFRAEPWALRREYRNTFRDTLTGSETLIAGEWWDGTRPDGRGADGAPSDTPRATDATADPGVASTSVPARNARISLERGVADDLGVGLGDTITWDIGGVRLDSRVTSLREVEWARFDTNFFVVFEPGYLEDAPQNLIAVAHIPNPDARIAAQRDIVVDNPNVSVIDVGTVQATLARIIGQVTLAIRFMALFSVAAGVVVLIGAISASRFQRVRESVLLRTIGATRRQVNRILLVEYTLLGSLAAAVGVALGTAASWAIVTRVFELDFAAPVVAIVITALGVVALAATIGLVNGGEALRRTPLAVLREADM
jgi:putative ABC transport system permease protein